MSVKHEHWIERRGWTVVIRRQTGGDFIAYNDGPRAVLGRTFVPTRREARQFVRELREHKLHAYVSRATVRLQRHA